MTIVYNSGLDLMQQWETDEYGMLLLDDTYTEDPEHILVSDVVAYEIAILDTDYFRLVPENPWRFVDDTLSRITYGCDDPAFGDPAIGQTVGYLIVFKGSILDDTGQLIASIALGGIPTTGTTFSLEINDDGLIWTDQGA